LTDPSTAGHPCKRNNSKYQNTVDLTNFGVTELSNPGKFIK